MVRVVYLTNVKERNLQKKKQRLARGQKTNWRNYLTVSRSRGNRDDESTYKTAKRPKASLL